MKRKEEADEEMAGAAQFVLREKHFKVIVI
jgi:hypothetical protein